MDAEQCRERAAECAANALISTDEAVSIEFLRMAAQWRAMAVRDIFLGSMGELDGAPVELGAATAKLGQQPVFGDDTE